MAKNKGWRREPARHSLAARGIKSGKKKKSAGKKVVKEKYIGLLETKEGVITIVRRGNKFVYGGVANVGLMPYGDKEIDPDFSEDENLQALVEDLHEEYGEYDPDDD